ncbi:response regulator transcription factor [bacterium]|nr:response regulator transcription factor [bacterium]
MKNKKIGIILADDHKLFRDGLRILLEKDSDFTVIGEADNGLKTISMARDLKPDIIIMDISMPKLNGVEATRKILGENSEVRVIILSMHSDRRFVLETLKAGAVGYILKDSSITELADGIKYVMNNRIYLSAQISKNIIQDYVRIAQQSESSAFTLLSSREREVLQLLTEGKSNREVAESLNISVKTVETHRKNIMEKLNIHSIAELTKYAIREGITPLE